MHFCQLPYLVVQFAPLASLGSSVFVFHNLGRSNEMTSLLSFGYSPYRLLLPTFISGLFFTLFTVFVSEEIVPRATSLHHDIKNTLEKRTIPVFIKNQDWFRDNKFFYSYSSYNPKTKIFRNFYIVSIDEDFKVSHVKKCDKVFYDTKQKSWYALNTKIVEYPQKEKQDLKTSFKEKLEIKIDPKNLIEKQRKSDSHSLLKISTQISHKKQTGANSVSLVATWHAKLAYLLSTLFFMFSGFNLVFINTQRRKKSILIFLPFLLLAIVYWSLFITSKSLAEVGVINPFLGAWVANFLLVFVLILQFQANKKTMGYCLF